MLKIKPGFCKKINSTYFSSAQSYAQFTLDQEDYGRAIKTMKTGVGIIHLEVWA